MLEQKQLHLHNPELNEIGDCWRTCIACILHVEPFKIPHFYKTQWKGSVDIAQEVHELTNQYLRGVFNVRYTETPLNCTYEELRVYLQHYYKDMYVIVGCNSKHGGHSVVMKNDDYMWDPSIDNSGCVGPMKDGYWWVGLLVHTVHEG